ncbi:PREDICTED: auxin response factor 4-like [Camelina sativa]|uniref:Auxin response factor 4-like n=1 Tax=Camelina sativa TaxID=90675 RepID=A0ABM0YIS9_CAMSA|nr:PREDICTED: auxin response factor 4-like [Camelina sativa]
MSTNTDDGTPVHRDLWNACAGADVVAPFMSDHVKYIPKGHADHCSASLQVLSSLEYLPAIHCTVQGRVILSADPMTDEVFAQVHIKPCSEKFRAFTPKPPTGTMRHMISTLAKPIDEPAHLQQLSLSRSFLGVCSDQFTTFAVIDFAEKSWTFKLMFRDDHQDYLLIDDWASFVRDKSVQVGDVVLFLRDRILDNTRFAVRRASSVSVGRRNNLNLEAFSRAHGSLSLNFCTTITYYPNDVNSDFLVPVPAFESVLGSDWASGVRVSKRDDHREHQGTITEATFKISCDGTLLTSIWKCISVQWDEPGCFKRDTFSPWEVSLKTSKNGTMMFGVDLSLVQGTTKKKKRGKSRQTQA